MEQMRIVKEMRERDRQSGRTAWNIRPRYMVWENVPGAFTSGKPKGSDFAAVLEEIIKICEPDANLCVCVPDKGWTKSGCYYSSDGRWSIAWRVHDAQFWGVPQRRKRIALVADFAGLSAPEICFERKGLSGDFEKSEDTGERTSERTESSPGTAIGFNRERCGAVYAEDVMPTLQAAAGESGNNKPMVFCLQGGGETSQNSQGSGINENVSFTVNAVDRHGVAYSFDSLASNSMKSNNPISGCREVDITKTLDCTVPDPAKNQGGVAIVYENHSQDSRYKPLGDTSETVSAKYGTGGNNQPLVTTYQDVTGTVDCGIAKGTGNQLANQDMFVTPNSTVRRLTPLECERLQGFPDGWTDIGDWIDSKGKKHSGDADSPRYKALGNSIAIPFWQFLARRICAQYERPVTLGSLFDGIGGFPLAFSRCGAIPVWASEIEEFPIAVTKMHFPEAE